MNRHFLILPFILLITLGLLTGCSDESSDPIQTDLAGSDSYTEMDFTQPYGGLTVSDESEAFDDDALKAMMYAEDGEENDDEFASDSDVQQLMEQGHQAGNPNDPNRPRFTFLRLAWGQVHGPEDSLNVPEPPCDVLDWTGEIHTDRGIVLVRRIIRFEGPDHLVRPRIDRKTVAFVSHTACHFDGLLLQIIERPADVDTAGLEPNRLHINTGPFSGVYEVEELAGLSEIHEIDDAGNVFQMNGFTLSDVDYCPKGFLSGRYRRVEQDEDPGLGGEEPGTQIGRMVGTYMNLTGRIGGFLRGGYGLDADGNRVFFGKYIDRQGNFRGLLAGTWEPAEIEGDMAQFEGHWVSRNGNREGLLGGRAHPVEGVPGGFFEGRWTTICDDEAEEQIQ